MLLVVAVVPTAAVCGEVTPVAVTALGVQAVSRPAAAPTAAVARTVRRSMLFISLQTPKRRVPLGRNCHRWGICAFRRPCRCVVITSGVPIGRRRRPR